MRRREHRHYRRLFSRVRESISRGLARKKPVSWITWIFNETPGAIIREIRDGGMSGWTYRAVGAENRPQHNVKSRNSGSIARLSTESDDSMRVKN